MMLRMAVAPLSVSHVLRLLLSCSMVWCRFPFEQRATLAKCQLGRQLFDLMVKKQSNLAVAADVPTAEEMLRLADAVCPC